MKVKDLREILSTAPDEAEIVVGASDHSYRKASVSVTTAMRIGGDFWEDHKEAETLATGKRVQVVVFE